MKQERLFDLYCDQRLVAAATAIIEQGSCAVAKPVRAGFTTSAIVACERKGWPLVVLAPTTRILKETVNRASGNTIRIPGNNECFKLKEMIRNNPVLAQLPMPLPDCDTCSHSGRCKVLEILNVKEFKTAGLTYAKLEALMLSSGKRAKQVLSKLSRAKVVLLDEAHIISLPSAVSIRAFEILDVPDDYRILREVCRKWFRLCQNHTNIIQDLMEKSKAGYFSQHLSITISNSHPLNWRFLKRAWKELLEFSTDQNDTQKSPKEFRKAILTIRDIVTILSNNEVTFNYVSEQEGETGSIFVSAGQVRLHRILSEFLRDEATIAKHIYVSGTLVEADLGFFSRLSGQKIKYAVFPDIRNATEKMTLIPDRWKLTSRNFHKRLPQIIKTINAIALREKQPIYLLAPSAHKARVLQKEIADNDIDDVFVDYYRSDHSMGVERQERICISVGLAEIPANACDPLARGGNAEEKWLNSRKLRRQSVDAATWQAVNRVRDPEGKVDSRVYFIGCRVDQIRQVATWGTNRQIILKDIKETRGSDGKTIRTPVFDVQVDLPIKVPTIYAEDRSTTRPSKRSVAHYVESVELYDENFINPQKRSVLSIINNRAFGTKLEIYNYPSNNDQIYSTATALNSIFVNRSDCFAVQAKDGKRWGYQRVAANLTEEDICNHINGKHTFGVYQIGLDDQLTWCCDDIDSHHGEADSEAKVKRVISVLQKYSIPFLLEASGSPDSYHIWIFLAKTKTYKAYRFIRQVNAEASLKCEAFPKQKSLRGENGKFGNLVKLPICVNKKGGQRSVFLDAGTFQPLEGPIRHPGIVHLYEVPYDREVGMPKVYVKPESGQFATDGESLSYCMIHTLEDGLALYGSEGHHFRLAIAARGRFIGMSPEDIAEVFENQPNYDYEISLAKVQEVLDYDISPWSCETLREKCGDFVRRYCPNCPFGRNCYGDLKAGATA